MAAQTGIARVAGGRTTEGERSGAPWPGHLHIRLPQFVDRGAGQLGLQMLLLGALVAVIALASDTMWAFAAGTARSWFAGSPRRTEKLGATGGLAMIGVGVGLAVTGRKD